MPDLTPEKLAELRALRADLLPWLIGSSADQAPCDRGELRTILDPLPALLDAAAERDRLAGAVERVRALATEWATQPNDYDEDTEQQIEDGGAILRALDDGSDR